MQWSDGHNAGFSSAPAGELYQPVIEKDEYAYQRVNVAGQQADPDSQLNWTIRMIQARRTSRPMSSHHWELVPTGNPAVLAIRYQDQDDVVLTFHNLSPEDQLIDGERLTGLEALHPIFADGDYSGSFTDGLKLKRFGYLWLTGRDPDAVTPASIG